MTSRDLLAVGLKGLGVYIWVKLLLALPGEVQTAVYLPPSQLHQFLIFTVGGYGLYLVLGLVLFIWGRPLARLLGEEDNAQVRLELPSGWQQQAITLGLQVAGILLVLLTITGLLGEASKWSRAGITLKECAPGLITGVLTCGIGVLLFAHRRLQGWFAVIVHEVKARRKEWAEVEGPGGEG